MRIHPAVYLILVAAAASLLVLQGVFDRSDLGKAERLVRDYRIGGPALGEVLEDRHRERSGPAMWSSEILSSCRGVVRVTCTVPAESGEVRYRFDVDLVEKVIHPADGLARAALEEMERASPPRPGS